MRTPLTILLVAALGWSSALRAETPAALTERLLIEGKLAEAEKALNGVLATHPDDAQVRFGLGTVQFLRAVERVVQSFHRYGLRAGVVGNVLPFARLPIPPNEHPETIRYTDLRAMMQAWNDDLAKAEATLSRIENQDVKFPLHFGQIRLDLDGDGTAGPEERLWKLYIQLNAAVRNQVTAEAAQDFVIAFDRGDVAWLRGYCHLLMSLGEAFLAYDGQELFDHSAGLFYPKPETPFPFLRRAKVRDEDRWDEEFFFDAIALIHELRLPLAEPARMNSALAHLESMIALSHESWKFILAETDDDHEWVPNTKQHTVMPGGTVTMAMVKGWLEFLDEARAILTGEKLIPFWRSGDDRGVNLRRVFTEPRGFDLVLWVQGTAAVPYLEKGPKTQPDTWRRFQNIFRGEFIGFALWFN
jgi:hypothetical protein